MAKINLNRVELVGQLFSEFPSGKGVGIGTFKELFYKNILESWKGTLFMLEVCENLVEDYVDTDNHDNSKSNFYNNELYNIGGFEDRVIVIRGTSRIASDMFPDKSLDFVYIDANHDYDSVKENIEIWHPKIKEGGYLLGHDYLDMDWYKDSNYLENSKNKNIWDLQGNYIGLFGVNPAVDEFCKKNNYDVSINNEWYGTWYIKKDTSLKPKDICVLSLYDDNYQEMANITIFNNLKKYCDLHGYTFHPHKIENIQNGRFSQWQKIDVTIDILKKSNYKWIFYLDTDCLVMNSSIKLESLIDDKHSFIVPALNVDAIDTPIINKQGKNSIISGQYLVKNNDIGLSIMEDIWNLNGWPVGIDVNTFDFEQRQIRITINKPQFYDHVNVVEEHKLNRFWYINSPYMASAFRGVNDSCWKPGDFIVHVTGYKKEERIKLLNELSHFVGGMLVGWSIDTQTNSLYFTTMDDFDYIKIHIFDRYGNFLCHYDMKNLKYYLVYSIILNDISKGKDIIVKAYDKDNKIISMHLCNNYLV
jgi:hypothetical protein